MEANAKKLYEDAAAAIQVAEDSGFQNLRALQRAHASLEQAIELAPQEAPLLFLMAYLWYLMGSAEMSLAYLKAVLTLQPEHEQARELQQIWAQQQQLTPLAAWQQNIAAFEALPVPRSEAEFDFLYAEIEAFLQYHSRYFMQIQLPPHSTLDAEIVAAQQQVLQQLNHVQKLIDQKMALVAEVLEVQALEQLNRPLRQIQQRFENALWYQGIYQVLQAGFDEVKAGAVKILKDLKQAAEAGQAVGHFQNQLNALLDQCDALADDLDAISEKASIAPIEAAYEEVLRYVQHVQDSLDSYL